MCKTCSYAVYDSGTNREKHTAYAREQNTNLTHRVHKYQVIRFLRTFCAQTFPQAKSYFQSVNYQLYTFCTALIIRANILYKEKRSY